MKRTLWMLVLMLALVPVSAGSLQKEMKRRLLGAWVVTGIETYSDCAGMYTNSRVNGSYVRSRGARRFLPGELTKVDNVDAKRSRLDLHLSVAEPVLVPYQDGPFTLYREARCRVELEITIPRELIKAKNVEEIEQGLIKILERFATEDQAWSSPKWNEREVEDYPADYEITLAEHAAWEATMHNHNVQAQLDHAYEVTTRLPDRINGDPSGWA